ncbi:hypothetical protein [Sphingomonas alpina]|uniref:hypothetical protein n=1 Tax=Sphingomonas alpina TaxID=653931 RepID=UPI001E54E9BB|nr:hypothetical protein [Sphingomonas alpina]
MAAGWGPAGRADQAAIAPSSRIAALDPGAAYHRIPPAPPEGTARTGGTADRAVLDDAGAAEDGAAGAAIQVRGSKDGDSASAPRDRFPGAALQDRGSCDGS